MGLLSKTRLRSVGLTYLFIAIGLIAFARLQSRYRFSPDFPDRTADGHHPVTHALVAASRQSGDSAWIDQLANPNTTSRTYTTYIYHTDGDSVHANATLRLAANKGREANVYLSFIIDHYEFLPEFTVFIHGHESAWHQEEGLSITLQMLNFDAVAEVGYVNLRCDWYPSCPAEIRPLTHDGLPWGPKFFTEETEYAIASAWPDIFPDSDVPHTLASPCCAQFAVTRDAIRLRDKETYIRMQEWLMRTPLHDDISGRVFEKLWAYIFTNEPIHCPPPPLCACKYFGNCDPSKEWMAPPFPMPDGGPPPVKR